MKHVLIVWELGGNLGHLSRLHIIATALVSQGAKVTFAVRNYSTAHPWLAARGWDCVRAPRTQTYAWGIRPPAGHADWYLCDGFDEPDNLTSLVKQWSTLMEKLQPDHVLLDFAPSAAYAIHCLKVPYTVSSIGFCVPPETDKATCFRPWDANAKISANQAHLDLLKIFATARQTLGLHAASSLSDLFPAHQISMCTFAELDHFPDRSPTTVYHGVIWDDPPDTSAIHWQSRDRRKVFCYLNGPVEQILPLLDSLKKSEYDIVAVVPRLPTPFVEAFAAPYFQVSTEAINISEVISTSDAVICHGGAGLVGRSLCAGVPVFLLPQYAEQAILGRRLSQQSLGAATSQSAVAEVLTSKLEKVVNDPVIRQAVLRFSSKYKSFSPAKSALSSLLQSNLQIA